MERRGAFNNDKVRHTHGLIVGCFDPLPREAYCEMKIKEKGITGKQANVRREQTRSNVSIKGFSAFKEMERQGKLAATKDKPKPEIFLEFMGHKIRVYEENEGSIKDEDVPHVKGSVLKFTGLEGTALDMQDVKVRSERTCD